MNDPAHMRDLRAVGRSHKAVPEILVKHLRGSNVHFEVLTHRRVAMAFRPDYILASPLNIEDACARSFIVAQLKPTNFPAVAPSDDDLRNARILAGANGEMRKTVARRGRHSFVFVAEASACGHQQCQRESGRHSAIPANPPAA